MASSISNGLVLTTAMVVSTTVLYLAFSRQKTHSPSFQISSNSSSNSNKQNLRSCLYSEEKRRERKKKRVKFAEDVMVKEERERDSDKKMKKEQRKQNRGSSSSGSSKCRNGSMEILGMPENRVALYKGMLRDRGHRMACCH